MVDHFGGNFVVFILAFVEVMLVMWWYGLENFCNDLEFMLKRKVGVYWRFTWGFITPVLLLVIFIYFVSTYERLTYGNKEYPDIALVFGWLIVGVGIGQFLMWMVYYIYANREYGCPKASANFGGLFIIKILLFQLIYLITI